MATTTNYGWTLLGSGSEGWDGENNSFMTDVDLELKAAQTPMITMTGEVMMSLLLGEVMFKHYQGNI